MSFSSQTVDSFKKSQHEYVFQGTIYQSRPSILKPVSPSHHSNAIGIGHAQQIIYVIRNADELREQKICNHNKDGCDINVIMVKLDGNGTIFSSFFNSVY